MIGTYRIGQESDSWAELLFLATTFGLIVGLIYLAGIDFMRKK